MDDELRQDLRLKAEQDYYGGPEPTAVDKVFQSTLETLQGKDAGSAAKEYDGVADRLVEKFGLGDNRALRWELYSRLERECQRHGKVVYRIIGDAVKAAASAREPGRYFASVVARRMREAGFFCETEEDW